METSDSRREDYAFYGTITSSVRQISDVLCKLFLPKTPSAQIRIECCLNERQFLQMSGVSSFALNGTLLDLSGQRWGELFSNAVHVRSLSQVHKGFDLTDRILDAFCFELTLTHFLSSANTPTRATFWMSPNVVLAPMKTFCGEFDGTVRARTFRRRRISLPSCNINFDFVAEHSGDQYTAHISRYLAADVLLKDSCSSSATISELTHLVDDIALIASFAARRRTVCFRWNLIKDGRAVTHYRTRVVSKHKNEGRLVPEVLIDYSVFLRFLKRALARLTQEEDLADHLRLAMRTLTKQPHLLEHDYIALFSALETLVLYFRRRNRLEFILEKDEWNQIRKTVKAALGKTGLSKQRIQLLMGNLNGLNRVALNDAFAKLCMRYKVDVTDLWPFSGPKSLMNIRNRLSHGEPLTEMQSAALMTSIEHLRWTMERLLLGIFGWPVEESGVSKRHLGQWRSYHDWRKWQMDA